MGYKNGFNIWSMDQSNNRLACLNKDDLEEQYTAIDIMKSSKIVVDGQRPTVSDLGEEDKQFIQIVLRILKFGKTMEVIGIYVIIPQKKYS